MPKADIKNSTFGTIGEINALRKLERLRSEFEGIASFKQKLGVAFTNLEGEIADVRNMARITRDIWLDGGSGDLELASFSVSHLCEMVEDLETLYRSLWDAAHAAA